MEVKVDVKVDADVTIDNTKKGLIIRINTPAEKKKDKPTLH